MPIRLANLEPVGLMLSTNINEGLNLCDILIDFSQPEATLKTALFNESSLDAILLITGTTGYSEKQEKEFRRESQRPYCIDDRVIFHRVLICYKALVKIASEKLNHKWDVEILEMHHKRKRDAPSGTALMLGAAVAEGRRVKLEEKDVHI